LNERAFYAPAVVAFIGPDDFPAFVNASGAPIVGWFPLAPREVYRPSYPVTRRYFENINRSNAVIEPARLTSSYNNIHVSGDTTLGQHTSTALYANQRVNGAIVAMQAQAFAHSQSVAKSAAPVSAIAAINAPVTPVAPAAPILQGAHGVAPKAGAMPPVGQRDIFARTQPPSSQAQFAAQPAAATIPADARKAEVFRPETIKAKAAKEEQLKGGHLRASTDKPEASKPPATQAVRAVPPKSEADLLLEEERRKKLVEQRR
jgi:hypothetical protein